MISKVKETLQKELEEGDKLKKFKCPNCHRERECNLGTLWVLCGCGYEMIEIKTEEDYPEEIEEYDRELIKEHFEK